MPELLLSGQDLAKAFGAAPLFEGLSFGIFEGDHIGLVGPNGSGKSTLLKILAGLEPPSAGTRSVRKRLRIGYVPQDPVFAPGDDRRRGAARRGGRGRGRPARARGTDRGGHGQGRVRGRRADRGQPLRRMEEAAGHRLRAGPRARAAPARRAHEPPRRRGHPLARGAAAARAGGLRGREPRPLLPGVRRRPHAGAEPRVRGRALRGARARTASTSRRRTSCSRTRRPTRSRCATACAASWNGSRARRRRGRARRRRGSTPRAG